MHFPLFKHVTWSYNLLWPMEWRKKWPCMRWEPKENYRFLLAHLEALELHHEKKMLQVATVLHPGMQNYSRGADPQPGSKAHSSAIWRHTAPVDQQYVLIIGCHGDFEVVYYVAIIDTMKNKFYRQESQGSEKLSNLPEVSQHINDRTKAEPRSSRQINTRLWICSLLVL